MSLKSARLVEIFSSIQGEGIYLGEKQTFVRFQGCALRCRWCDTTESFTLKSAYKVEKFSFSNEWEKHSNPVSAQQLEGWLEHFSNSRVSLTGGEPLEQVEFLESWLPSLRHRYSFLLETNGVLPQNLNRIISFVDVVSMDIKLPSSTRTGVYWNEHENFLKIAQGAKECYVKIVITSDTQESELNHAIQMVRSVNEEIPVILQPASFTRFFRKVPKIRQINLFADQAKQWLKTVRVIPQTHKILGVQ